MRKMEGICTVTGCEWACMDGKCPHSPTVSRQSHENPPDATDVYIDLDRGFQMPLWAKEQIESE